MPHLYIMAGPNGAGKSTASQTILPEMLNIKEFVNADEIAKGISPFNPEGAAFEAGRYMLGRIRRLILLQEDFAFETTLASKSYSNYINDARQKGYMITLCFFWLPTPQFAVDRVRERVRQGGHHVPEEIIHRRFYNGLRNFFHIYIHLVDDWLFLDNTGHPKRLIAEGVRGSTPEIHVPVLWDKIQYDGNYKGT